VLSKERCSAGIAAELAYGMQKKRRLQRRFL